MDLDSGCGNHNRYYYSLNNDSDVIFTTEAFEPPFFILKENFSEILQKKDGKICDFHLFITLSSY